MLAVRQRVHRGAHAPHALTQWRVRLPALVFGVDVRGGGRVGGVRGVCIVLVDLGVRHLAAGITVVDRGVAGNRRVGEREQWNNEQGGQSGHGVVPRCSARGGTPRPLPRC